MNNTSHQRGNHNIRFGASAQRVYVENFDSAGTVPGFGLGVSLDSPFALTTRFFPGGVSGDDLFGAESLLATVAGLVSVGSQTYNVPSKAAGYVPGAELRRNFRLNSQSFYVQDSWRVKPRLTLNLGVRWEDIGRFSERDGLILSPVIGPGGVVETLMSDATIDFAGSDVGRPLSWQRSQQLRPKRGHCLGCFR